MPRVDLNEEPTLADLITFGDKYRGCSWEHVIFMQDYSWIRWVLYESNIKLHQTLVRLLENVLDEVQQDEDDDGWEGGMRYDRED